MQHFKIDIKPSAEKQFQKLDKKTRQRIKAALIQLEKAPHPFLLANMRPLTGQLKGDYRLRVGDLRVLITPFEELKILYVYAILPRGGAY